MTEVSFGEWLKRQRMGRGLTREQLAQQIGCAAITLRKIEAEERHPSAQIVERLANIFNIPQNERIDFLRFARGNWSHAPGESVSEIPWHSTLSIQTNVPTPITSFIGREKEQSEVTELLAKNRLVTLTGVGGIGKTRLSLQVAQKRLSDYPDGIWFVELAPVVDPLLVPRITALALGLREEPQNSSIDMLCHHLRAKKTLVILDNCEHLIEVCGQFVNTMLRNCPDLKILVTSREALGVLGEAVYHLPSLTLPKTQILLDDCRNYESVRLFEERARLVRMDFSLNLENISAVAQICVRLDGIPLAIELAAARVSMFSTDQIAVRLQENFNLLTTGNRAALPRHQTLQTAIDWSYNLLPKAEKVLFRRLSIFVNGWTLQAAESVCIDKDGTRKDILRAGDILESLAQLVHKSLVVMEERNKEVRYHMLETIRHYANEKLVETGEADLLHYRHLGYFLYLAEHLDRETNWDERMKWKDRIGLDDDNFRAALEWCLSVKNTGLALRLLSIWAPQGRHHFSEILSWFDKIHKLPDILDYPALYAELLNHIGANSWLRGNDRYGKVLLEESQSIWLNLGADGELGLAFAYICLGEIALGMDMDTKGAQAFFEKSFELYQRQENKWGMNRAMYGLAHKAVAEENYKEAEERFTKCLSIWKELGENYGAAGTLGELGMVAQLQNDYERAYNFHEQSINIFRELRSSGILTATALCNSAWPLIHRSDCHSAKERLEESLQLSKEDGNANGMIACLAGFASILGMSGKPEAAMRLFGAFETLYERSGARPLDPSDSKETNYYLSVVRTQLDEATWTKAWAQGCEMTLDQVIAYALDELRS